MPRLDNGNEQVIKEFGLSFNPEDPGATDPVDICLSCSYFWPEDVCRPVHPPYEEMAKEGMVYVCLECGAELGKEDN